MFFENFPGIELADLYYINTHGKYDIEKYNTGIPVVTTVPPLTIVIETAQIDEFCFFTHFKEILNPLFVDITKMIDFLSGKYSGTELEQKKILTAFSKCQFYLPGGEIPNRILYATGGLYRWKKEKKNRMESQRRGYFSTMGFFKYFFKTQIPELIFKKRFNELIEWSLETESCRGTKIKPTKKFETYETIFKRINNNFADNKFKIIFFSSCGCIKKLKKYNSIKIEKQIKNIQVNSLKIWETIVGVNYNKDRHKIKLLREEQTKETKFSYFAKK